MDVALLALAYKAGIDPAAERRRLRVISDIPFESEKRYAATAYETGGEIHLAWTIIPSGRSVNGYL